MMATSVFILESASFSHVNFDILTRVRVRVFCPAHSLALSATQVFVLLASGI